MSLHKTASKLAAKGRHGDSVLVHMHPDEVRGLAALAVANGTPLTRNPETGMPEAFSLRSLLPAIAGLGLTALSGGALTPLMAAGLVGGGTALTSGSLSKGLMAGLGAYGGAGLGAGLGGIGAAEAADAASSALMTPTGAVEIGAGMPAAELGSQAANTAIQAAREQALAGAASSPFSSMWEGTKAAFADPNKLTNAFGGVSPTLKAIGMAGAPVLADAALGGQGGLPDSAVQRVPGTMRPYTLQRENISGPGTGSRERLQLRDTWTAGTPYNVGYAGGGLAALAGGGSLGSYSDGGRLLRGAGDGVSDSIPATINDKQPARLADGEFVIPSRIVSELGNGSTEAGAKQLYAMMDRIQKRRTATVGKGKFAKDAKAYQELPA